MNLQSILMGWDGDHVQITLSTGEKVEGGMQIAHEGQVVFMNVDQENETVWRTDHIIGVKYLQASEGVR